jgi:uncharacterized protein YjlB
VDNRAETYLIKDDGTFPNNDTYPLLVYRAACSAPGPEELARAFEAAFAANDWPPAWRNGVFDYHHYHSTAHEVLGCYSGSADVQFGGPAGPVLTLSAGDAVLITAGIAHKRIRASRNFALVGAYPAGLDWDMNYGRPGERDRALANIRRVPVPDADPVYGTDGPLTVHWRLQG